MWFQCVRYKTHILKNTEKSKLSIILLLREDYFSVLEYVLLNFFSLYLKNIFMAGSIFLFWSNYKCNIFTGNILGKPTWGIRTTVKTFEGLPWQSGGKDSAIPMQGARVPPLVRELRSRMPRSSAKKKKKREVWGPGFASAPAPWVMCSWASCLTSVSLLPTLSSGGNACPVHLLGLLY